MDTGASWVRVYWLTDVPRAYPLPQADSCCLVASGPGVPVTAAVLIRTPAGDPPPGGEGFADEHLVAEAGSSSPWSKVADVLIVRAPPEWAATLVAGRPGRLVTAYDGPGREAVLDVAGEGLARLLSPAAADHTDGDIWPYASFVHAWRVAGRRLGALHGAYLTHEAPVRGGVRVSVAGLSTAWPAAS